MSPQLEHLKSTIAASRAGDEAATARLRETCMMAVGAAPPKYLQMIGDHMIEVGRQTSKDAEESN